MNKKIALTVTCILVGIMLLVTTAFAGVTGNSGYEVYKQTLKKSFSTHSFTTKIDAMVSDNGNVLGEVSANIKSNYETMSSNIAIKTKTQEKVIETYVQEERTIIKDSDTDAYLVVENNKYNRGGKDRHNFDEYNNDGSKAGEAIVDAFVGDLKNYFLLDEKADGSKDVGFEISGSQIPSVINAIASIGIKEASIEWYRNHSNYSPFNNEIKLEDIGLPKLVDDIRISNVDVRANVSSEDILNNQSINITVHGKDAAGQEHEVVISMDMSFFGHGSTTPDTINLTGKEIKVIEPKEFDDERHWD